MGMIPVLVSRLRLRRRRKGGRLTGFCEVGAIVDEATSCQVSGRELRMEENAGRTHKNARLAMISSAADTDSAIFRSLRGANFGCDDEPACVGGTLAACLQSPSI